MKKIFTLISFVALVVLLNGCGKKDENTIVIGATPAPHAEILEFIEPLLEEKGYKLDIKVFNSYTLPNKGVTEGSLDANYFQHVPYLDSYNEENKTDIVNVGGVHFEPIGIYTKNTTINKDDVTTWEGVTVVLSNSVTDQLRILKLLEKNNLITLKENASITDNVEEAIESNPYSLVFQSSTEPNFLTNTYINTEKSEKTVVAINTNFVLDAINANLNLFPQSQRILSETVEDASQYVNIIAVNEGNEDLPKIKALIEVLQSEEVEQFIRDTYNGAVIPAE